MRIVSFTAGARASFGLLVEGGVIDVGVRLETAFAGFDDLLRRVGAAATLERLSTYAALAPDLSEGAFRLDKPLANWGKCFCVGVNFPERNAEYQDGSAAPQYPSLFVRFPESFVSQGEALVRPPESRQLDYEGEIVMVIGKIGRRIPAERWADYVFGWTLGNEGTIRDWVRHGKFNVTPGKNWQGSGSIGPWIVPFAEIGAGPFEIVTRVNGEERQRDSTARMMFPFDRIVEYISTFCTLRPGDIIFTGTPAGAGARMMPPAFLAPGDRVEVECAQIGRLTNGIRDE